MLEFRKYRGRELIMNITEVGIIRFKTQTDFFVGPSSASYYLSDVQSNFNILGKPDHKLNARKNRTVYKEM